jgi:hypothetical protein
VKLSRRGRLDITKKPPQTTSIISFSLHPDEYAALSVLSSACAVEGIRLHELASNSRRVCIQAFPNNTISYLI